MRQFKIIAGILLILPIIPFAFALPIAQEACQLGGDVVPDVAKTMLAKRGGETEAQPGVHYKFESLSRPESSSAAAQGSAQSIHPLAQGPASIGPDYGSMDPQIDTSEIQQLSPELTKSPSLDHYLPSSPESFASTSDSLTSSAKSDSSSPMGKLKSFLGEVIRKVKFWRRLSGPGSAAQALSEMM